MTLSLPNTEQLPGPLRAHPVDRAGMRRLLTWGLLSLLIHLLLLSVMGTDSHPVAPAMERFLVHLNPSPQVQPPAMPAPTAVPPEPQASQQRGEPPKTPRPPKPVVKAASTPLAAQYPAAAVAKAETIPPRQAPSPAAESIPVTVAPSIAPLASEQTLRSQLLPLIKNQFQRYFSYPTLARRRGWQGEVILAFQVHPDGLISERRIARGSGHGLLDKAALAALQRIQRLPLTGGIQLPSMQEMQLPVIYQLKEG